MKGLNVIGTPSCRVVRVHQGMIIPQEQEFCGMQLKRKEKKNGGKRVPQSISSTEHYCAAVRCGSPPYCNHYSRVGEEGGFHEMPLHCTLLQKKGICVNTFEIRTQQSSATKNIIHNIKIRQF